MNIDSLFDEEQQGRYSHAVVITAADLAALPAGATGSFTIASLVAGDVFGNVAVYLDTPFVFSDAALISSAITVGDTGSATTDLASTETAGVGSFVKAKAGTSSIAQTGNLAKTVFFTATAAHNLNTATAGKLVIVYSKISLPAYGKV